MGEIEREGNRLLEDVKRWGQWVLEEAKREIGRFYPPDPDGSIPVGYIWARTVRCQNPGCMAEIPLTLSLLPEMGEPDSRQFLEGSARVALQIDPPFDRYIFIENKLSRCAELESLKNEFPKLSSRISIENNEANLYLHDLCYNKNWKRYWKNKGWSDMALYTQIEWSEVSWNPLTGCTKISAGCKNCYAERMARRLQAMGNSRYSNGFKLTTHEYLLEEPLKLKKPHIIFVNSMSDLFHKDVPVGFIQKVFAIMEKAYWHQFQILTKRSRRMLELNNVLSWPDNVWMGVTVENSDYYQRIDNLRQTGAKLKFISFEPLLGPCPDINLEGIHWVIVGGESGPGCRPVRKDWIIEIRDQCLVHNIPFFFKQWGGTNRKKAGRLLEGKKWDAMPVLSH